MRHNISLVIAATIFSLMVMGNSLYANDTVHVALHSTPSAVSDSELSIGDVCEIRGGTIQLRKRISQLDLDSVAPGETTVVSKQQVAVRIALAGIARDDINVSGPDEINVRLISNESLKQRFESKIETELSSQFGIPEEDVRVRLLDLGSLTRIRESLDTTNFKVVAYFTGQLPLGDRSIQLELSDFNGRQIDQKVRVQIAVSRDTFVTSRALSKGTVITASHVQSIKRPMMDNKVELAGADCLGCIASRDIAPHEVITTRHISRKPLRKQIILKRNDLVDVILTRGPLTIRVKNAKVMTRGAKGDRVRVLNTNSNKEINAIVQDSATVLMSSSN